MIDRQTKRTKYKKVRIICHSVPGYAAGALEIIEISCKSGLPRETKWRRLYTQGKGAFSFFSRGNKTDKPAPKTTTKHRKKKGDET